MHALLAYRHLAAMHTSMASISRNNTVQLAHQNITDCSIRVLSMTPTECFIRKIDHASRKMFIKLQLTGAYIQDFSKEVSEWGYGCSIRFSTGLATI